MNKKLLQVGNIIGFIAVVIVNLLAVALPLNGKTTQLLSDNLPNLFVPIGLTFSIWSIIYVLLGMFAFYQAKGDEELLEKIGIWFILSSIFNVTWIFLWHYEQVALSVIIMLLLFASLLVLYLRLGIGKTEVSKKEKTFIHVPISVYFGWITTATVANITAFLVSISWDGFGITEEIWAVLILVVVALIYVLTVLTRKDVGYGLVGVWAALGIFLKQQIASPIVAYTALGVLIAVGLMIGIAIVQKNK